MMASITVATRIGTEFAGRQRILSIGRILAFSGGPLDSPEWPSKNLHTDKDKASEAGLSAPIASGIQYESHLIELLCALFGERWFEDGVLNVKYPRPVRAGDAVQPFAKITAFTSEGTIASVELDVWCARGDGEKVLVGTARCHVPLADASATK